MNDMARCGAALLVLLTVGGASALAEPQAFPSAEAAAQALREALEADRPADRTRGRQAIVRCADRNRPRHRRACGMQPTSCASWAAGKSRWG
jgi:hypothetical protein